MLYAQLIGLTSGPARRRPFGGDLWRHRDFRLVWAGESVSSLGSQVSLLALPLVAVRALHASVVQIGGLTAAGNVAYLVVGLPAGVWVDRLRRRPLMIGADLGSALALASVPVAAALGVLRLPQLFVVAFAAGVLNVVFGVAWQPYLPTLIDHEQLLEGNAKMTGTAQVAAVAGPGVAGLLVQALGGAYAVAADAASFLVSAAALRRVRATEPPARARGARPGDPAAGDLAGPDLAGAVGRPRMRSEIVDGLRYLLGQRVLRMVTASAMASNFAFSMGDALAVVFLARTLHQSATAIGLLFAAGGVGGIAGAMSASPGARLFGARRVCLVGMVVGSLGMALLPLAYAGGRLAWFAGGQGLMAWGIVVFNITMVSFRQRLVPNRILGRVVASQRVIMWGTAPLGALAGGALGQAIGVRSTLWVAAASSVPAIAILLAAPMSGRDLPAAPISGPDLPAAPN